MLKRPSCAASHVDLFEHPGFCKMSGKFIGFHRLIEACDEGGCPACRCLDADTHRYLTAFLYEHVTDPVSRSRLRASWGLCNWHAWMLRETADPAFGSAILCEDLLRVIARAPRASRIPGRDHAPPHCSDGCARDSAGPGRPTSPGSTAGGSSARPAPSWPTRRSGIFRRRCASSTIPSSSRPTRRLTACACRMRWLPSSLRRATRRAGDSCPGRCRSGPICVATSRAS